MGSVEVRQLPLPFPLRICRLSQRDSEPQGQDRVEAGERVQRSAYRGKKSRHGKTYSPYALRVGGTVSITDGAISESAVYSQKRKLLTLQKLHITTTKVSRSQEKIPL